MIHTNLSRGRPRIQGIVRFNVATDLTEGKKFIRFRRSLDMSVKDAYVTLVRFFNFVAVNYAFRPQIDPEDVDIIADYCWFDGSPEDLLTALKDAGFLDHGLTVHDWYTHQPLAEKIVRGRGLSSEKSMEKGISGTESGTKITREDNIRAIPPTPLPTVRDECGSVPEPHRRPTVVPTKRGTVLSVGDALSASSTSRLTGSEVTSEAEQLCADFCHRHGYTDPQTCAALYHRIQLCGSLHGLDCVRRMIGEIHEDHSVQEPIKVLHFKLNQAIATAREAATRNQESNLE